LLAQAMLLCSQEGRQVVGEVQDLAYRVVGTTFGY